MEKWNISTDRVQRADEKNGIICLVIVFTPRVMIIEMSEMAYFFVFSSDDSKKPVTIEQNIYLKDLIQLF